MYPVNMLNMVSADAAFVHISLIGNEILNQERGVKRTGVTKGQLELTAVTAGIAVQCAVCM